jgi:ribosomal protein S27AE
MLDKGFWADVELAGEHLRLFSEDNAQGVQISIYDVNGNLKWPAKSCSKCGCAVIVCPHSGRVRAP